VLVALVAAVTAGAGCALLDAGSLLVSADTPATPAAGHALLQKIPAARDAVVLEVVFIERPAGDPLLGPTLWREVDEIASIDLSVRRSLERNGLRVGRVGANPPRALQTLLGMAGEIGTGLGGAGDEKRLVARRVTLPSGGQTEVTASDARLVRSVTVLGAGGQPETESYENARCVFRIHARKLQEGWARVEFLPEIHHDQVANRLTLTAAGAQWRPSQKVDRLYDERFAMDLNIGEMVLVTCGGPDGGPEGGLGENFFRSTNEDHDLQRMLVVRLVDLNRTEPVFAE
jgi:hypothetical protein